MLPTIILVTAFLMIFAVSAIAASAAWNVVEKRRQKALDSRLQRTIEQDEEADPDLLKKDTTSMLPFYGRLLEKFAFTRTLQQYLAQANLKWSVGLLTAMMLVTAFLALNILIRLSWFPGYLIPPAVLLAGMIPYGYVMRKRSKRLAKFEEQFPEALDFLSRAMRAGHAFSISLELLSEEAMDPVSTEFRRTFDEHNLGLPLENALQNLAVRVPLLDVRFFVSAVLLQARTGGNLSEILLKLAQVIRERFKLRGQVRALSAHGRLTGKVLTVLPVVVVLLMMVVNPEYMVALVKFPIGKHLIGAAIIMQGIAFLFIRKIVNIEV
jgi:tight adherence protein B